MAKYKFLLKFLLFSFMLSLFSCSDPAFIEIDYQNKYYQKDELKRENARVVEVVDNRGDKENYQYKADVPVSDFIKRSLNEILNGNMEKDTINPITVHINKFELTGSESPILSSLHFDCGLYFSFPVTADSFQMIKVDLFENKFTGKAPSCADIIYPSITKGVTSFLSKYDESEKYCISSIDSVMENVTYRTQAYASKKMWRFTFEPPPQYDKNRWVFGLGAMATNVNPFWPGISGTVGIARLKNMIEIGAEVMYATALAYTDASVTYPDTLVEYFGGGLYSRIRPIQSEGWEHLYIKGGIYYYSPSLKTVYTEEPGFSQAFGIGGEKYWYSLEKRPVTVFMEFTIHHNNPIPDYPEIVEWFSLFTFGIRY